jgi:hypothetical protein
MLRPRETHDLRLLAHSRDAARSPVTEEGGEDQFGARGARLIVTRTFALGG